MLFSLKGKKRGRPRKPDDELLAPRNTSYVPVHLRSSSPDAQVKPPRPKRASAKPNDKLFALRGDVRQVQAQQRQRSTAGASSKNSVQLLF